MLVEQYKSQILNILTKPKLMLEIGKNGSRYENFSWETSNKALIKILNGKQSR